MIGVLRICAAPNTGTDNRMIAMIFVRDPSFQSLSLSILRIGMSTTENTHSSCMYSINVIKEYLFIHLYSSLILEINFRFILQCSPMTQSNLQLLYTVCMSVFAFINHMGVIMGMLDSMRRLFSEFNTLFA